MRLRLLFLFIFIVEDDISCVEKTVLQDLMHVCRQAGKRGFEIPQAILLAPVRFSEANGLLTPTQKLCRPRLAKYFEKVCVLLWYSVCTYFLIALLYTGAPGTHYQSQC